CMALAGTKTDSPAQRRWLAWALAVVAIAGVSAFFIMHDDATLVRAASAERTTIRSVISSNGKVEPLQNFEAHTPIGTTVKRLLIKEGDHVKKGQLLVQLDDA